MKIEKLTENKIRIILKQQDLKDKNLDLHSIMSKAAESQGLFLEMLNQAKKEVGFNTDGHKLLIEASTSFDDIFVFTITKYGSTLEQKTSTNTLSKRLRVRRKETINLEAATSIYRFNEFEEFCAFCHILNKHHTISLRGLAQECSLYWYEESYYLILSGIRNNHKSLSAFYTHISEFAKLTSHSIHFEGKLKEHGEVIMKKNALLIGMKYFANR